MEIREDIGRQLGARRIGLARPVRSQIGSNVESKSKHTQQKREGIVSQKAGNAEHCEESEPLDCVQQLAGVFGKA